MPNKLILSKNDLDDPQALAGCKVGDSKVLTVTVTVTRDDPTIFEGDVTDVEYADAGDQSEPGLTEGEAAATAGSAPAPAGKAAAGQPAY